MRLTNCIRDAFIRSAMEDVPYVDYQAQAAKTMLDGVVAELPAKVRAVWDDVKTRGYLETWTCYESSCHAAVPGPHRRENAPAAVIPEIERLMGLHQTQCAAREQLKQSLRSVAYGSSTRKALVDKLPEFEKYLPAEDGKTSNLPALANIVTSFMQAGWPKERGVAA